MNGSRRVSRGICGLSSYWVSSASEQMQPQETSLCLGWGRLGRWEEVLSLAQTQSLAGVWRAVQREILARLRPSSKAKASLYRQQT